MHTAASAPITTRTQKETTKRSITLVDMSSCSIELTLWGALAENPGWSESEHPVVAVKGAKVSDFNSKFPLIL